MKYIRTKDKIMVFTDLPYDADNNGNQSYKGMKIADTIEELCDYFIYNEYNEDNSESGKLIFKKIFHKYEKEQLKSIMLDGGGNIKLGILTDKGLIYVAKMNEDGELCLI